MKAYLLQALAGLQSKGDRHYAPGLFPSQRFHRFLPYRREEDNIFFTASIAFILKNLKPLMTGQEKAIADGIINSAVANYPSYRNREGIATYNFFPTGRDRHFPNGRFIHRHYAFRPADDADDTALIHLTSPHIEAETIWLKDKLAKHANGSQRWMKHNLPRYRKLKAYSTFFGKDMYIDLDVCVLCNVLYWVLENELPLNKHDRDSIFYIMEVLHRKEHLIHKFQVGPSYPYPVHMLYHVARLIARHNIPALDALKPQLLDEARQMLKESKYQVEQAILATTIIRLGGLDPELKFSLPDKDGLQPIDTDFPSQLIYDFEGYDLFYVNPLAFFSNPLLRKIDHFSFFHMRCRCPSLYLTYILEYIYLREESKK